MSCFATNPKFADAPKFQIPYSTNGEALFDHVCQSHVTPKNKNEQKNKTTTNKQKDGACLMGPTRQYIYIYMDVNILGLVILNP